MDIYGLIHFIDETLLPDADSFYKRYFRKPENYPELSSWVSQFAFRTLKKQVEPYVNFTKRLPFVLNYSPQDEEKQLYDLVAKYLSLPNKTAYPQMDNYQLALQFYHTLSSSPQAFGQMLEAPIERAENEEKVFLQEIQKLALKIKLSAKMQELLTALKTIFAHLKSRKETQKVLIFVENSTSLAVLADLLQAEQYTVITHTDKNALEKFREDKNIQIFLTNDTTAKGLDIEYCPVVINYDLLYNAVEMEQRICRCHRQGQNSDVLVVNLLSKENMSDVRILELINKRTLQFQGIFGMSDDIVGNFDEKLSDVLQKRRTLFYFLNYSYILESWSLDGHLAGRLLAVRWTFCRSQIGRLLSISLTFGWSLAGHLAGHLLVVRWTFCWSLVEFWSGNLHLLYLGISCIF